MTKQLGINNNLTSHPSTRISTMHLFRRRGGGHKNNFFSISGVPDASFQEVERHNMILFLSQGSRCKLDVDLASEYVKISTPKKNETKTTFSSYFFRGSASPSPVTHPTTPWPPPRISRPLPPPTHCAARLHRPLPSPTHRAAAPIVPTGAPAPTHADDGPPADRRFATHGHHTCKDAGREDHRQRSCPGCSRSGGLMRANLRGTVMVVNCVSAATRPQIDGTMGTPSPPSSSFAKPEPLPSPVLAEPTPPPPHILSMPRSMPPTPQPCALLSPVFSAPQS
jgi:hypothetical protein